MATCKWCGKGGLFLYVNSVGLCPSCVAVISPSVERENQIIAESQDIINESKNIKTKLSRCDTILSVVKRLLVYEEKGIGLCNPPPSELIGIFESKKRDILYDYLVSEVENGKDKANQSTTLNAGVNILVKASQKIKEYQEISDDVRLTNLLDCMEKHIVDFKIQRFLNDAEKAAFKGQNKKAIDLYMEILFLIRKDGNDKNVLSKKIESDIEKLRENIPKKNNDEKCVVEKCKCDKCGSVVKEKQAFCSSCGNKLI